MFGSILGLVVAFALPAGSAKAGAVLSDRLLITDFTTGAVVFDGSVPEGPAGEVQVVFGAALPPLDLPGVSVVAMLEPAGEPTEGTPVFLPGTEQAVSDLVVSTAGSTQIPVSVGLISDGDPNFATLVGSLAGLAFSTVVESGGLQDLTELLHSDASNLRVQVQSDVVPEPSTALLFGAGLLGIGAQGRRARPRARV